MPNKPKPYRPTRRAEAPPGPRLNSTQRGYGYRWQKLRLTILRRDRYLCQACLRKGILTAVGTSGHVDHVVPREQGGTDDSSNLETKCPSCHSRKTATEDGGFGHPVRPKG